MNNNHQALWDDCLRLIRANVTEQQFKTWSRTLRRSTLFCCSFPVCTYSSIWSSTTLDY